MEPLLYQPVVCIESKPVRKSCCHCWFYKEQAEDMAADAAVVDQNNAAPGAAQPPANALEALLAGGAGNLQALLNIPDADDETMVQLAIALSLQDQVTYSVLTLPLRSVCKSMCCLINFLVLLLEIILEQ